MQPTDNKAWWVYVLALFSMSPSVPSTPRTRSAFDRNSSACADANDRYDDTHTHNPSVSNNDTYMNERQATNLAYPRHQQRLQVDRWRIGEPRHKRVHVACKRIFAAVCQQQRHQHGKMLGRIALQTDSTLCVRPMERGEEMHTCLGKDQVSALSIEF